MAGRAFRSDRKGKRWTVLVWIAGDNDLDPHGLTDIREMKRVGSTDDVDVVVQIDRAGRTGARRYHVRKGTKLASDVVARLPETNTGDPRTAIDFFSWGLREYPAERVMAVIWNHGSGIDETDVYERAARRRIEVPRGHVRRITTSKLRRSLFGSTVDHAISTRAIAFDDTSGDFLDNAELARVLAEVTRRAGRPLDVLALDACLMNMIEVGYELRRHARCMVASEETEPVRGWPWSAVLGALAARPTMTAADFARESVRHYLASYRAADGVTHSAVDLARVSAVAKAVDALAAACIPTLKNAVGFAAFSKAARSAQRYDTRDFVDLGDLCRELQHRSGHPRVRAAAAKVLDRLLGDEPFALASGHKGRDVARSTGTSIYLPVVGDAHVAYGRLAFAKDTRWDRLIDAYRSA